MDRLEMMRIAEVDLGRTATAQQISQFIQSRFGEFIGPEFIPLIRASLRGKEVLQQAREQAIRILAEDAKTQPKTRTRRRNRSTVGSEPKASL